MIDGLPVQECNHSRNRLHAECGSQSLLFVDIDFGQLDFSLEFVDHVFQHGSQLLTRTAPGSPEINNDRYLL